MDEQTLQSIETRLTRTKKRHFSDPCWETYDRDVNRLVVEARKHTMEHVADGTLRVIEASLESIRAAIAIPAAQDAGVAQIMSQVKTMMPPTRRWEQIRHIEVMVKTLKTSAQLMYVTDVEVLLRAVKGRDGIITDLTNDSVAFAEGQKQAYGRILDLLRRQREDTLSPSSGFRVERVPRAAAMNCAISEVLILAGVSSGERPTPLPNEELRLENERLRLENQKLKSHPD